MDEQSAAQRLAARLELPGEPSANLRQALIHQSYLNERGGERHESNERLEFLGDAILGAIVADVLYRRYPHRLEGELTMMRTWLIRASTLARWALRLDLGQLVLLGRGEERSGLRSHETLLAQVFEAVVGAVYLDRGLEGARSLILPLLEAELEAGDPLALAQDPKSRLQHRSQMLFGETPRYELVEATGPDHSPTFTFRAVAGQGITALGTGKTKQAAQQEAAEAALAELERRYPTPPSEAGGG